MIKKPTSILISLLITAAANIFCFNFPVHGNSMTLENLKARINLKPSVKKSDKANANIHSFEQVLEDTTDRQKSLVGLIDPYTGERTDYKKLKGKHHVADGVMIKREGKDFYERQYSGYVNVRWFGAKGDGISDDTYSLKKAIAYAAAKEGGSIFVPIGTYLTETLTIPAGVMILGENKRQTVFKLKDNFNGDVFNCYNYSRGGLSNFTINGNKQGRAVGSGIHISADKHDNGAKNTASIIRDIYITDCKLNGIEALGDAWIFTVENNYIQYCDGHGIYNTTTDNAFYFNDISNCKKDGFYNYGGSNTRIIGGKIISNGVQNNNPAYSGLHFESSNRCIVIGVECQDNYYNGFFISNSTDNTFLGVLADGNYAISRQTKGVPHSQTPSIDKGYGFKLIRAKNTKINGLATNYSSSSPSQFADRFISACQDIDFDVRSSNQISEGIEIGSSNIRLPDANINSNGTATASFDWYKNHFRLRIGGEGEGVLNGFDIQSVNNNSLFKIDQDRVVHTGGAIFDNLPNSTNKSDLLVVKDPITHTLKTKLAGNRIQSTFFADVRASSIEAKELYSSLISANSLGTPGDKITANYSGSVESKSNGQNGNLKLSLLFGNKNISVIEDKTINKNFFWNYETTIIRTNETSVRVITKFLSSSKSNAPSVNIRDITNIDFSIPNKLTLLGQSSSQTLLIAKTGTVTIEEK